MGVKTNRLDTLHETNEKERSVEPKGTSITDRKITPTSLRKTFSD